MIDNENIENLLELLKKVEYKKKREEFERYKQISDNLDLELTKLITRFCENIKAIEKNALQEVLNKSDQEEKITLELLKEIKEIEVEIKKYNLEFEEERKALKIKASKLKELYISELEEIEEEERRELKMLKKKMKNILLITREEAHKFSKKNIKSSKNKLLNLINKI